MPERVRAEKADVCSIGVTFRMLRVFTSNWPIRWHQALAGERSRTCGRELNVIATRQRCKQSATHKLLGPMNALQTSDDATEHYFTGRERDVESGND